MNQQRTINSTITPGGYHSRYRAFLDQRKPKPPVEEESKDVRLSQGLINFAIFIALFIGILTLFGFGLSRLYPGNSIQSGYPLESTSTSTAPAPNSSSSSSAVNPARHEETKTIDSPGPATSESKRKDHQ